MSLEAMVLMSGGIDSTACAHFLKRQNHSVRGVFFNYGQAAAAPESRAAHRIANFLSVPLSVYEVTGAEKFSKGELPFRNAFLIASTAFLSGGRSGFLAIGIHAGTPYFDCSITFVESMARVVCEHTNGALRLVAPFLQWTKAEIFEYFVSSGIPVDLTYSCEAGSSPPCGTCASCRDRRSLGC
jgi:7-cyano-7-deazaguanine synthase